VLLAHAREGRDQELELATTADKRCVRPAGDVDAKARSRLQRLPGGDRLALALPRDGFHFAVINGLGGGAVRLLANEDPVHGRGRLQPRGRVDDVAGGHALALARPGAEAYQRFARVDRDPHLQLLALLDDPVADLEGGAHGPLRVVLVGDRRAEEGHHRVADELLHRALEALELFAEMGVVGVEQRPHVLGVELLGPRGEPDQVREEDAHHLPLLPALLAVERSAAERAERELPRELLAATRTVHRGESRQPLPRGIGTARTIRNPMSGSP
jgi:hypothetical protein